MFLAACFLTVLALCVTLEAERRKLTRPRWIAKPVASLGFLFAGLTQGPLDSGPYGQLVFVGLILSAIGDVALLPRTRRSMVFGIGAFLLAHLAYVAAFLSLGLEARWLVLGGLATGVTSLVVLAWLWARVPDKLHRPVLAYMAVISAMVACAAGAVGAGAAPLVLVAAATFYASDLSVARDRFTGAGFLNRLWGLPAYYAAQLVFAHTIG
ncbi:MAG: lysoplasmalogenase [Planctomycetota bacterium]|jgi:uncharacterized membrane protein YhhN